MKNARHTLTRTLSAILVLLMLLSVALAVTGCADTKEPGSTDTTTAGGNSADTTPADGGSDTDSKYDSNGYLNDCLDPTLDFGNSQFNILAWEHSLPEFDIAEQTGSIIDDSVYTRNALTEDRLNVDLNFIVIAGNSGAFNEFCQTVYNSVSSGIGDYDAIGCYLRSAGVMTLQHVLTDLLTVEHLNFEMPWWSDSLLELNTINDQLYFISGDISTTLLYQMMFMVYNTELGETLNLDDPQKVALDGNWTQDLLFTMAEGVYADLDGSGTKTEGDRFGLFSISHPNLDIFYMGADLHYVVSGADGNLTLSDDVLGEKAMGIIDRLNALYYNSNDGYWKNSISSASVYGQGNSLFYNVTGQILSNNFRNSDMKYSILPAPKYDTAQEKYRTAVAFTHTVYCIPTDAKKLDMSGAVLECMASEGYRNVTPALFDTAFKYQYSKSAYDAEIFEIIRDNVVYDIARPFFDSLGGDGSSPVRIWRKQIEQGENRLSSMAKSYLKIWEKALEDISDKLKSAN